MAVVRVTKMAEFVKKHIVLQNLGKAYYIEVQVDVSLCRAASPVRGVVLYGDAVIREAVADGEFRQTRRQFLACPLTHGFYLICRRNVHILEPFLLSGHGLEDPTATGLKEGQCHRIGHNVGDRHADPLDRMHTDAYAPAPEALAEPHLPYLRINIYLSLGPCHINILSWQRNPEEEERA